MKSRRFFLVCVSVLWVFSSAYLNVCVINQKCTVPTLRFPTVGLPKLPQLQKQQATKSAVNSPTPSSTPAQSASPSTKPSPTPEQSQPTKSPVNTDPIASFFFNPDSVEYVEPGDVADLLSQVAADLKGQPTQKIRVVGSIALGDTGTSGVSLAEQRANKIAKELIQQGVASQQILVQENKEKVPRGDNNTPEGKAFNRRVDVYLESL